MLPYVLCSYNFSVNAFPLVFNAQHCIALYFLLSKQVTIPSRRGPRTFAAGGFSSVLSVPQWQARTASPLQLFSPHSLISSNYVSRSEVFLDQGRCLYFVVLPTCFSILSQQRTVTAHGPSATRQASRPCGHASPGCSWPRRWPEVQKASTSAGAGLVRVQVRGVFSPPTKSSSRSQQRWHLVPRTPHPGS